MEFQKEHIIEDLYSSGLLSDMESNEEYKILLKKYNDLYDSIEDSELKNKFEKLEEIKNQLYSANDKAIFKMGFSMAIKLFIEAISCDI